MYEPSPGQRDDAAEYLDAKIASGRSGKGSVTFADGVEQAVSDAQLVIETVPEQRELKRDVLGQLDHDPRLCSRRTRRRTRLGS